MAFLLLIPSLWMVLSPQWWIRLFENAPEDLDALERALATLWHLPWDAAVHARIPHARIPNDRRTRAGVRITGLLLAIVAAANLYESVLRMLAR
jgi:hypothetical protein